jgi:hypothetical protein
MLNWVFERRGKIVTDLLNFYAIEWCEIYENFK